MLYILALVAVLHVVIGYPAIREIDTEESGDRQRVPFQFSIMALLVLMVLVSVFFGLYKTFGDSGAAIGAAIAYFVIVAYCLRQFHVIRSRLKEDGVDKRLPHFPPATEQ